MIIPVYNGEKYVAQCIENMLCQTYKNLEIIVINDGSADGSATIAEKYPVQVISQKNGGLSAARNRGLDVATGDYVYFMDVDDLINLEFFALMIGAITLAGADMACCEFIHEKRPHISWRFSERLLLMTLEDKMSVTNSGQMGYVPRWLYKKSFLAEKGLRFEVGRLLEDVAFTLQAVHVAGKIVTTPGAIFYYKKRADSIMNSRDRALVKKREEHRQLANSYRKEFAQRHNLNTAPAHTQRFKYKILGVPMLEKTVYGNSKIKWRLFGICVLQRRGAKV